MGKLFWKDEYRVSVDTLDKQHKHIFEIINKLEGRTGSLGDMKLVYETLTEMVNYSKEHFGEEEKLMSKYDYPGLESQKKQHEYFINTTAELTISLKERAHKTADEIAEFLGLWWSNHILKMDMKYKPFFQAKIASVSEYNI